MVNKLSGNTKTWYLNQENTQLTWTEWKEMLEVAFPPEQSVFIEGTSNRSKGVFAKCNGVLLQEVDVRTMLQAERQHRCGSNTINNPFVQSGVANSVL